MSGVLELTAGKIIPIIGVAFFAAIYSEPTIRLRRRQQSG